MVFFGGSFFRQKSEKRALDYIRLDSVSWQKELDPVKALEMHSITDAVSLKGSHHPPPLFLRDTTKLKQKKNCPPKKGKKSLPMVNKRWMDGLQEWNVFIDFKQWLKSHKKAASDNFSRRFLVVLLTLVLQKHYVTTWVCLIFGHISTWKPRQ